jgi:hypothetical protein
MLLVFTFTKKIARKMLTNLYLIFILNAVVENTNNKFIIFDSGMERQKKLIERERKFYGCRLGLSQLQVGLAGRAAAACFVLNRGQL